MLLTLRGGVNYCYNWLLGLLNNASPLAGGATRVDNLVVQRFFTSPLAGEVCFTIEMELKSGKQGEGSSSQLKVESGKRKVISSPDGEARWGATPLLESVAHCIRTASFFPKKGKLYVCIYL